MTYYLKRGSVFNVTTKESIDLHEELPVGNYTVRWNEMAGEFYLETVDGFTLPPVLYGDTAKMTNRILETFADRESSTGVLLSGEKGSGKTLQAKALSVYGALNGYPTIVINHPWAGEKFNQFMQTIEQPVVVLFDEFEKTYDRQHQVGLLTLLDGVYPTKKLFVLTCNDRWSVDEHMHNRPGRLYYRLDYTGLESDFIRDYCIDNLNDGRHLDTIVRLGNVFQALNFDILKALVEEMNRYDESPEEAMRVLNAKPAMNNRQRYGVACSYRGREVRVAQQTWQGDPLKETIELFARASTQQRVRNPFTAKNAALPPALQPMMGSDGAAVTVEEIFGDLDAVLPAPDEDGDTMLYFRPADLVSVQEGVVAYRDAKGFELTLTPQYHRDPNVWALL